MREKFLFFKGILNIVSHNIKSSFDNPEFSGPNNIAVSPKIKFEENKFEKLSICGFSKNLFLADVPITKLKLDKACCKFV